MPPWSNVSLLSKQRRCVRQYGQQERVMSNDMSTSYSPVTPSVHSIRTTSVSRFDQHHSSLPISSLCLFTGGFRTFPSTKPLKLMVVLSFQPSRL
ncbi:hypothetical protein ARMGADRAFT_1169740 [Armillaria gallica]|uniref:Uncharacterized protein n=1 Tax=Armillaria gallica TaxID=47427 RepID=A0A2H3CUN8_ARMGA|nr:hypothetical protein ARMGADRAFT_1169740 [Armillaria gallica]